jgi:TetR/AcrR family transcriptional regulator, tetracycline repressor protein
MPNPTGRPRSGDGRLTPQRILEAALEIVDAEGMDALSMRRLGRALGVDPMAVYHHLPNKQAVITGVVRLVFAEIEGAMDIAPDDPWQDRVRNWARTYRTIAHRHRPLIIHLIGDAEAAGPEVMRVNDVLYGALEAAGMAPRDVVRSADMIVDYIHGLMLGEHSQVDAATDWRQAVIDQITAAPDGEIDAIRRTFTALEPDDLGLDFEFSLNVIIAGLERRTTST